MPVVPNTVERLAMLRLNRGPGPVLDLVSAGAFHAAALAVDIGLFDALADGPRSASALARDLGADEAGLDRLLAFLDAAGYVADHDGRYRNTDMTTRWLTDRDPNGTDIGDYLLAWERAVFPFWAANIETAVREGRPLRTIYEWLDDDPELARVVQRGFLAVGRLVVEDVVEAVELPDGATRILDVGGGHGLYSAALCRAHPGLEATVFDRPDVEPVTAEVLAEEGMAHRVSFVGGDYLVDDLGTGYDAALLFNVVHAHTPEEVRALLDRVAGSLRMGGLVAVIDQFEGSARTPAWHAALQFVSLNYLATIGASIHEYADLAEWLSEAGFANVRRETVGPGTSIVLAERVPHAG
ncbi:acetylserotonin O-methyltransferase [Halomarina litorea]|uniref:acetylserotonin O-methyltransferase n=1 Tax=Halomarina litorea TaxID=2961595 RepID=UPI0020C4C451|nr:acetylserotonin O-methyltransferase [Halomarina sp. BCD28]